MSSKLGTILSMIFIIFAFLFGSDLMTLQYLYSDLDAKSVNISYLISRNATIDDEFVTHIENKFNVTFLCDVSGTPAFGDEVKYVISHEFTPLMMSKESITVSVSRYTIVGFYG